MDGSELARLVSSVGTMVGLIIAASLILQTFLNKYTTLFDRYRKLAQEYRETDNSTNQQTRVRSLWAQITIYKHRCQLVQNAIWYVTLSEVMFLITIFLASSCLMWPNINVFSTLGIVCLLVGLSGLGIAVIIVAAENGLSRDVIDLETKDLMHEE